MKKLVQTIRQLHDRFSGALQRLLDCLFGEEDDDEDFDPWNLDYDEPDWIDRLGDWLYAIFYGDD